MGAVEHLKTLCCLGLPPGSARIAVAPLLHEIVPHGWYRACLFEPDATLAAVYAENHTALRHQLEGFEEFVNDPKGIAALMLPAFRAGGIGWTLGVCKGRAGWRAPGIARARLHSTPAGFWTRCSATAARLSRVSTCCARPFSGDDERKLDPLLLGSPTRFVLGTLV